MPKPHAFYANRTPQGVCKHCGKEIVRDRWTTLGWAHYESSDTYCSPMPERAEPE